MFLMATVPGSSCCRDYALVLSGWSDKHEQPATFAVHPEAKRTRTATREWEQDANAPPVKLEIKLEIAVGCAILAVIFNALTWYRLLFWCLFC